jgi:ATP-dependent helicase/DNAse subunit B
MRLILGPPGSGKTSSCLEQLRAALRAKRTDCRLIVPTATMGEHLRNELAREGFVFKPALVSTFTKFVEPYCIATPGITAGAIEILVAEVLARLPLTKYAPVRDFAGFRASIVHIVEEFSSAGGAVDDLTQCGVEPDFVRIYNEVLAALKQRNLHLRGAQLRQAADKLAEDGCPGVEELIFTGFYSFTAPELEVLRALESRVKLTIALAEWSGAQPTIDALSPIAARIERLDERPLPAHRTLCVAPTLDVEVSGIARRMLQAHDNGRPWREMGVLVRSEAAYVPALRSVLQRFGIPARFYFSSPLKDAPAVRYIRALMEAMLSGWDHIATLRALRLPGSPLEAESTGDAFEFAVLKRAPDAGLDSLRALGDDRTQAVLDKLDALTSWSVGKAFPETLASRLRRMRTLFASAELQDQVSHELALLWRSHAAALDAFEAACDAAAGVLEAAAPIECKPYWDAVETILAASELRVPDHRRDVVHIIDAFEARQWSLPVVYVCGLLEKEFPKYQTEDAILPDAIRRRMQALGVQLRTSVQRQADERFLFDLALTRGREAVVLSYPELNGKGEANLPSFFLHHARPYVEDRAADVRPHAERERALEPMPLLATEEARRVLLERHGRFAPTHIETYLQCPFQFFAQRTLKLRGAPEQPWERLNALVQGLIVHRVLERSHRERRRVSEVFDEVFTEYCADAHVPDGYRTEAVRLELLYNLEMMEADERLARGVKSLYEEQFTLKMAEGVVLNGKIDRIELDGAGNATIIDYKYKSKLSTDKTKKGHEERTAVQGGLYLLGAESLGYTPVDMFYCGMKRDIHFAGWMTSSRYPDIKQAVETEQLQAVMQQAREDTLAAIEGIRGGNIAPQPADEMKCQYCDLANSCRYEVAAMEQAKRAGR